MLQTAELEKKADDSPVAKAPPLARRVIFVSHATPQDNLFAGWLS